MAAVLVSGTHAAANGPFEVPANCGTREQFEQSVRGRLGNESQALLDALDLSLREQLDGSFMLTIRLGDETRIVQDRRCEELMRAAVVVAVALWDSPNHAQSRDNNPAPAAPSSLPAPSVAPLPVPATAASSMPTESRVLTPWVEVPPRHAVLTQSQRHWLLGTEVGITSGLQPKLGSVLALRGAFESTRFGLAASLRWLPASSERDANNRGVRVTGWGASVAGYFRPLPWVALDAGLGANYLLGSGLGSRVQSSAGVVGFGPLLGAWLVPWQSDSVRLSVGLEAQLQLLRPHFEILEYGQVFRVSSFSGATFLAADYRFE